MVFVLIGGDKLKVCLTAQEVESMPVDFEDLDHPSPRTKKLLVEMLEQGKAETGFSPKGAKLFVEIYPDGEGGYVLYFTALNRQAGGKPGLKPVIFAFEDADVLCDGSARLYERYGHRVYKSSLYRYRGEFLLVVYPLDYSDRLSVYFISEYARKVGEGELLAAFIEEHGEEILRDAAIDTLAEYFG
jgi:negative regulator of genetic competence, sporulation and motility